MDLEEKNHENLIIHRALPYDEKDIEGAKEHIRFKEKENLYVFKNKLQILRFEGEADYVNPAEEYLLRIKDCTIIHNHPKGTSFSISDIKAITLYDAYELFVVSPYFNYVLEGHKLVGILISIMRKYLKYLKNL